MLTITKSTVYVQCTQENFNNIEFNLTIWQALQVSYSEAKEARKVGGGGLGHASREILKHKCSENSICAFALAIALLQYSTVM